MIVHHLDVSKWRNYNLELVEPDPQLKCVTFLYSLISITISVTAARASKTLKKLFHFFSKREKLYALSRVAKSEDQEGS